MSLRCFGWMHILRNELTAGISRLENKRMEETRMKKKIVKLMALCMAAVLGLTACGQAAENPPAADSAAEENVAAEKPDGSTQEAEKPAAKEEAGGEKVVTLAATAAWMSMCPLTWVTKDAQIAFSYPVFDTLVNVNADGEITPRLLQSWEQSEDGLTITGKLNPDAKWHDGEKVTANDIVFTYSMLSNSEVEAERTCRLITGTDDAGIITDADAFGIKAVDDETVEFTLKQPTTLLNFFYTFRFALVVPEHCLKDIPAASLTSDPFWENPVGSGPFKFDSYISGERMEYTAFDEYYLGRPDFDRLIIRVIPANNILSAMMSGEVDSTVYGSLMSYNDYELAKQDASMNTLEIPGFQNDHLFMDNEKYDATFRVAVDHAIDKQAIIDNLLHGYGQVAISAIYPDNPYRLEGIEGNAYDPELAKEMLSQTTWDQDRDLVCLVQADQELRCNVAVMLQQMLAEVGINITVETGDMATISSRLMDGDYDFAIMGSASAPFEPSESSGYFNVIPNGWTHMTDTSWAELYNRGLQGATFEERCEPYYELQRRLVAEVPMAFLYHKDQLFAYNGRLTEVPFEDFSIKSWKYWEWKVQ